MLSNLPNPQSHQKPIQGRAFTGCDRFQEESGRSIGKSIKCDEIVFSQAVEVAD